MTIQQAYQQLLYKLYHLYDDREAANISNIVMEYITTQQRIDRIVNKSMPLSLLQEQQFIQFTKQLLQHEPVQYVLQEAWFAGMKFYVNASVLRPRPETEELIEWILEEDQKTKSKKQKAEDLTQNEKRKTRNILDIGTGSGCIAIALKKKLPDATVHAMDISEPALHVANKNALNNETAIHFFKADILDENEWKKFPDFDIIVSNPPYIKQSETAGIKDNVMRYEPHAALFVADEDALLFYRKIASFGLQHLSENGKLFFEINEMLGKEVCKLLLDKGYKKIELKKDLHGKDRMVMTGLAGS